MPRTPDARPSGKPLPPKLAQTETPSTGASGKWPDRTQPAPSGSRQGSALNQGGQPSTSGQGGMTTAPRQGGKSSTPHQSGEPASTSGSGTPAASGGPSNLPPGRGGAGDGTWTDWYEMYMRETQGRISEPPGPPYPIGPAEARQEAVGQIYDRVDGKEPPSHNIASRALRAYYTRVNPQTLSTWACQILCMIAEYHMACVTRGSPVTSLIVPRGLEERLPPLADYAPPEDQSGATDVQIRDHRARTLRVAVLCWIWPSTRSLPPLGPWLGPNTVSGTSWPTSSAPGLPGSYDSRTWSPRSSKKTRGTSRRSTLRQLLLWGSVTNGGLTYMWSSMPRQRPCRWSPTVRQAGSWNTG